MFKSPYKPVPDPSTQPLNPPGTIDSQGQVKGAGGQRGSNPVTSGREDKKDKKKKKKQGFVSKAKQVRMAGRLTPGLSWYQRYKLYKRFKRFKRACCCCLVDTGESSRMRS